MTAQTNKATFITSKCLYIMLTLIPLVQLISCANSQSMSKNWKKESCKKMKMQKIYLLIA